MDDRPMGRQFDRDEPINADNAAPPIEPVAHRVLDFDTLREQNHARMLRWHGEDASWGVADWATAMGGECGEALNVVKKIRRHEVGLGDSYNTPEKVELEEALAMELADIVAYADLLADHMGIDLGAAVRIKFNEVSENQGFPERI